MWWKTLLALVAVLSSAQANFPKCITTETMSVNKNTPNTLCVFPFVFKNKGYNGCTLDKEGKYWCSTKVEDGTNVHVKGHWGYCPSDCDRSCSEDHSCKLIDNCPLVKAEFERYKSLAKVSKEKPQLRQTLKALVCNTKPKKFCCPISSQSPAMSQVEVPTPIPQVEAPTPIAQVEKPTPIPQVEAPTPSPIIRPSSPRFPPYCQKEAIPHLPGNKLPRRGSCGISCNPSSRVVNGEDAKLGEFPWAALLGYTAQRRIYNSLKQKYEMETFINYKCGGTLINTWYVVTAAHCHGDSKASRRIHQVVLGEWEVSDKKYYNKDPDCATPTSCLPKVQNILVDRVVVHENFIRGKTGVFNDIALVRLKSEAILNSSVQLACLPVNANILASRLQIKDFRNGLGGYQGTVIGWGHTQNYDDGDYKTHSVPKAILQKAELPLLSMSDCQDRLASIDIEITHMCAGGGDDGADSCKGDSGGGIFIRKNTTNQEVKNNFGYVQVGLVSFGSKTCGDGTPGVYTRLSEYIDWIKANIKP